MTNGEIPATVATGKERTECLESTVKGMEIHICLGPGGVASGGGDVVKAFEKEIRENGLDAGVKKRIKTTGCRGLCAQDVLVDIYVPGMPKHTYCNVASSMVPEIVDKHLRNKTPVEKWLVKEDYASFYSKQKKQVLKYCGRIDPDSLDEYIEAGGYAALRKALKMQPEEVLEEIKASGIRGRGGAGFPTGLKWGFCKASPGSEKYIIANGSGGDPGAFVDRAVMEGSPSLVIEGLTIAAYTIGANYGYIYCNGEYPMAVKRLRASIVEGKKRGYLGKNILGSGFDFDCKVKEGAGAFVCGEETALMNCIEGYRGVPRARPPFPAHSGLWGKPTNINNVETLSNIPIVIDQGGAEYAKMGTEKGKGTKVFSLAGKIKNSGLIEAPMGITVREIIFDMGGGIPAKGRRFKAVQMGGPSGGCVPTELLDTKIDFDSLKSSGAMMGSGGMVVMDSSVCMVDMARIFMSFNRDESCGKCTPCRVGTQVMLETLEKICRGDGEMEDLDNLVSISGEIMATSLCALGQTFPNPFLSTLRYFRNEYEAHIRDKRCPANSCTPLIDFIVDQEECVKCGLCGEACPVPCIDWGNTQPAFIRRAECTTCKACIDVCPVSCIH